MYSAANDPSVSQSRLKALTALLAISHIRHYKDTMINRDINPRLVSIVSYSSSRGPTWGLLRDCEN